VSRESTGLPSQGQRQPRDLVLKRALFIVHLLGDRAVWPLITSPSQGKAILNSTVCFSTFCLFVLVVNASFTGNLVSGYG
jgi:hypothetical protein